MSLHGLPPSSRPHYEQKAYWARLFHSDPLRPSLDPSQQLPSSPSTVAVFGAQEAVLYHQVSLVRTLHSLADALEIAEV